MDDAFHWWCAEYSGLDFFLTLDKRFRNAAFTKRKQIGSSVAIVYPRELCEEMGLPPTDIDRLAASINPFA